MKRARFLWGALLLGAGVVALSRGAPPAVSQPTAEPLPPPPRARTTGSPPAPRRNPFEFDGGPARVERPERPRVEARAEAAPAASARVRLVGFVLQGQVTRVAIVIDGETFLLRPGEEAVGYMLLSADENVGVRLRAPTGSELALPVLE